MIRHLLLLLALAAPALSAQQAAPLAPYAGTKVAVVPVQFFHVDSSGWGAPSGLVLRAAFDSLLSEALNEHGLGGTWATPVEVQRAARRNVMYAGDPRNLGAFPVRYGTKKETPLADPFASNLRRIVALHDARYALVPVELHVNAEKSGGGHLGVRLLLVDARLSSAVWQVDLIGESAASYTPALLLKLATRVADLVVAP
ncbi:MAG: hypothetical protein AABZ29_01430 [Gemmatimonadota bacterium]